MFNDVLIFDENNLAWVSTRLTKFLKLRKSPPPIFPIKQTKYYSLNLMPPFTTKPSNGA